jgi:perosamine synthetase
VLWHRAHTQVNGRRATTSGKHTHRRLALLGGTATWTDCLAAAGYLFNPRRLIVGPAITEYEQAFARQIGVRHAYSFSAGRVGLYGILRALRIGPGHEVLLQVPTHIVVANAIRYTGAKPVFVDCQLNSYNMDLEQAERRITSKTKALVLQHTFGIPADLDAALALQQRYGVALIEDCVHALGARYDGRAVGSFGRAAFFSTEETKTISSTMGGMVVTNEPDLASRIESFQAECAWPPAWLTARYVLKFIAYFLLTEPHLHWYTRSFYEALGRRQPLPGPTTEEERHGLQPADYQRRLSNAQAAIALRQLRRLEANLAHRRAIAEAYRVRLAEHGFRVPQPSAKAEPAFVRYPVWVEDRKTARAVAAPHAVLGTWFTSVLEEAYSPACGDYEIGSCPRAEAATEHLVNLPTHPRVKLQDVDRIVSAMVRAASFVQMTTTDSMAGLRNAG